jgi:malate dehydrogenase (oxaloacetate-decarboxylating)(NADP+)
MNIPVFHDDQHGTSIIVGSALLNALKLTGKKIEEIKIIASGAGAAALSCLDLLCALGARKENIIVADSRGLLTTSREGLDDSKNVMYKIFHRLSYMKSWKVQTCSLAFLQQVFSPKIW